MFINSSKPKCIRFGPRYKNTCANITTRDGKLIEWVGSCRYLGLFFISGPKLKTSNDNAKAKFYRAFNSYIMEEMVTVSLIKAKCLPIFLYGTNACHFSIRETTSLEYPISCALIKVVNTKSWKFLKIVNWLSGSDLLHYLLLLGKDISITNLQPLIMHFVRLLLPPPCQAIMWPTKR